mgnify:CR=1 FL=1
MFMDFKFFDDVVAALETQRSLAMRAWELWIDELDKLAQKK